MECPVTSEAGSHPLDPLSADEVAAAARRALAAPGLSDQVRVVSVELREPDKADYLAWKAGGPLPPREAFCVLLDNGRRCGVEAVIPLAGGDVVITDLRVDWTDSDPVAELADLWARWQPLAADYVARALDPAGAPSYGVPGDE